MYPRHLSKRLNSGQPFNYVFRSFHPNPTLRDASTSPLETRLRQGLKDAMKSKDRPAAFCLKAILADVTYASKSSAIPSDDALPQSGVIQTIRKGIHSRIQAAESYSPSSSSPHPEMYRNLQSEISLLQSYLPQSPSPEALTQSIQEVITDLSEVRNSRGAAGAVMKGLWEKLGDAGQAVDRKEIGKMVGEMLKGTGRS